MLRLPRTARAGYVTHLRRATFGIALLACDSDSTGNAPVPNVGVTTDVVASNLDTVWELAWAPDGFLWMTERGGRVSRVNPETGAVTRVGDIAVAENGEGGLMGLALHPDFPAQPWVYLAHTYQGASGLRNRVVRARFDGTSLGAPEVLVDDIPGSSIHNGSRVAFGPDRLLYVTTGDAADPTLAQNRDNLAGKILRLTPTGQPAPDNPFGTRVFSLGHRNPQGLTFGRGGAIYITEHGPSDNDEVNRIEAGRNYGWPHVRGRCDGDAGSSEIPFCAANSVVEPLAMFTPTVAPAGVAYYDSNTFPAWRHSLLFVTLKEAKLYRLTLSEDGRSVTATDSMFADEFGRMRALLVAPDGTIYIGTSNRDGRGTPMPADDKVIRVRPR